MKTIPSPSSDRLPPHSLKAEQAVLGCIMLNPIETIPTCVTRLGPNVEAFYDLRHQQIYEVMTQMFDAQEPIDLVTLSTWLGFQGLLDGVGGLTYLGSLTDSVASAQNIASYLDILCDLHTKRKLIRVCVDSASSAYENAEDTKDLVDRASQELFTLASAQADEEEEPMHTLILKSIDDIERMHQNQGEVTGLRTGFVDFDKLTTGLQPGDLFILAARPSMGKTSLAMNIAEHVAVDLNLPVGVFSLEMTRASLVLRMLCSRARVNIRNIREGFLAERDFPKITGAAGRLRLAPLHINDRSGLTIMGLRTRARRMHQRYGIKLLVVDYLQLLSADRGRNSSRQEEVSQISGGLKGIAKDLGIPVLALSQLNRQIEQEKNRKPRLSDLRESGAIEQDADIVAFLYKPKNGEEEDGNEGGWAAEAVNMRISKQRNGPTGEIPLTFLKGYTRFESAAKVCSDDVPQGSCPVEQPEML